MGHTHNSRSICSASQSSQNLPSGVLALLFSGMCGGLVLIVPLNSVLPQAAGLKERHVAHGNAEAYLGSNCGHALTKPEVLQ